MHQVLQKCRSGLRLIGQIEMVFAATVLIGIVVMILVQVVLNAGLGRPIVWEQEGGAYALVWLTFVGASVGMKQMRHVTIVSFVSLLPPRLRAFFRFAVFAAILWTLAIMLGELSNIMQIEGRSTTVALPIDLPRSYFFSVPLTLSCVMMAATTVLNMLEALVQAISPQDASDKAFVTME